MAASDTKWREVENVIGQSDVLLLMAVFGEFFQICNYAHTKPYLYQKKFLLYCLWIINLLTEILCFVYQSGVDIILCFVYQSDVSNSFEG